jgi:hypothetical protein
MTKDMALRVDHWRARQPGIPTRVQAIRRLIEAGLKAEAGKC